MATTPELTTVALRTAPSGRVQEWGVAAKIDGKTYTLTGTFKTRGKALEAIAQDATLPVQARAMAKAAQPTKAKNVPAKSAGSGKGRGTGATKPVLKRDPAERYGADWDLHLERVTAARASGDKDQLAAALYDAWSAGIGSTALATMYGSYSADVNGRVRRYCAAKGLDMPSTRKAK